jgi:hypothetical protein
MGTSQRTQTATGDGVHSHARQMLEAHPKPSQSFAQTALLECIEACFDCAQACTSCADACLGEDMVQQLVRCIGLNLNCADICATTGRAATRQTEADVGLIQAQLQACIQACRVCGAECERHGEQHRHCAVCAEACRNCERACSRVLEAAV